MLKVANTNLENLRFRKRALITAVEKEGSAKWILRQWSRFIRERDGHRCVCCESDEGIQAHHIVRKTLYPWGAAETGNGITLCRACHRHVHEKSNGRADLSLPLGEGDDQDDWTFLFGLLLKDAQQRGLGQDEFYFFPDHMLKFFLDVQGYENLYVMVMRGEISRISYAHEIWRSMPKVVYENFVAELFKLNM